jgi:hypothetical protein
LRGDKFEDDEAEGEGGVEKPEVVVGRFEKKPPIQPTMVLPRGKHR